MVKEIDQRSAGSQPNSPSPTQSGANPSISIHDNKREYLKEKKRKDLEILEADLRLEKERLARLEEQF
jgi:septal ring factor EnvC (AmiA/AmiB activator)